MKVLVVEDDADIASLLKRSFKAEGIAADHAATGRDAFDMVRQSAYSAIILDVMLPDMTGHDICRTLRKQSHTATIIMLSAKDTVSDRIDGLAAGADDYVVKPFVFEEVLARLHAQQRRRAEESLEPTGDVLQRGALRYDQSIRELSCGGKSAVLTEREADLLLYLMRNEGTPLTREGIFDALWQSQGGAAINVVDVYVGYLRRKLALLSPEARASVRTVRNKGYMFVAP
jgi:DNA-binding response OmpR family regulator